MVFSARWSDYQGGHISRFHCISVSIVAPEPIYWPIWHVGKSSHIGLWIDIYKARISADTKFHQYANPVWHVNLSRWTSAQQCYQNPLIFSQSVPPCPRMIQWIKQFPVKCCKTMTPTLTCRNKIMTFMGTTCCRKCSDCLIYEVMVLYTIIKCCAIKAAMYNTINEIWEISSHMVKNLGVVCMESVPRDILLT